MKYANAIKERAEKLRNDWEKNDDIRLLALDVIWANVEKLMDLAKPEDKVITDRLDGDQRERQKEGFAVWIFESVVSCAALMLYVPQKIVDERKQQKYTQGWLDYVNGVTDERPIEPKPEHIDSDVKDYDPAIIHPGILSGQGPESIAIEQSVKRLQNWLKNDTLSMLLLGGPEDPNYAENICKLAELLEIVKNNAHRLAKDKITLDQWFTSTSKKSDVAQIFSISIWNLLTRNCSHTLNKSEVARLCCDVIDSLSYRVEKDNRSIELIPNPPSIDAIRKYFPNVED